MRGCNARGADCVPANGAPAVSILRVTVRRVDEAGPDAAGSSSVCVASFFVTSRVAVMKHLRVLEDAGLVVSEKQGRLRRLYFNVVPIQMIHDRWSSQYSRLWASRVTQLKYRVEESSQQETQREDSGETR